MADEELDKGADAAENDKKATEKKDADVVDTSAEATETSEKSDQSGESDKTAADVDADDDLDLPMDKIDALLSATSTDKKSMSPQLRRVAQRQAENSKRVEETIKGTKANPSWFVPLFCFLMILGLAWAVVYYLTSKYPIPGIGAWNLLIAFCIVMVGFIMTMWWR